MLDLNHDGVLTLDEMLQNQFIFPFASFLRTPGFYGPRIDAQILIRQSDLSGHPAFLFSYKSLRILSAFYSDKEGIAHALAAKLDAAEASEERGNSSAKAGELKAFANQVNADGQGVHAESSPGAADARTHALRSARRSPEIRVVEPEVSSPSRQTPAPSRARELHAICGGLESAGAGRTTSASREATISR